MSRYLLTSLCCLIFAQGLMAQAFSQGYQYSVDLNKVSNDQLVVELTPPPTNAKALTFHVPKIVPGTYSIYDFGRFVSGFRAMNKKGKELPVKRVDDNTWVISKAKKLAKVTYTIEDTWDTNKGNKIFEPAGTNIEKERVFVFNNHGMFGYFKDYETLPFYLTVDRPENFYGSSTLIRVGGDSDTDIFEGKGYNDFVDHPMMFCRPDTVNLKVGNANVLISTYSPSKKINSQQLVSDIAPILEGIREYLGGTLPVDRYAFLLFLTDGFTASGGYGALEHNYSSMYVLPEMNAEQISQTVRDVAAHEFFHIVTPLNIHSEEIHYFDFINPKMSKHLWLYEGVTEYSASHVQVKQGLMPIENFLDVIGEKVRGAEQYTEGLPFTEMSEGCLDEYKDEYTNVYQKGALIGMCIDLELRILSKGDYGIRQLMEDLSKEYGKDKPFKDDELFGKIAELTFPEMETWLNTYVAGPTPLPIPELLTKTGIQYFPEKEIKQKTIGGLENAIDFNPSAGAFYIKSTEPLDEFGKAMGLETGDVLKKWNGSELTIQTINQVLTEFYVAAKEGEDLSIEVEREGEVKNLKSKVIFANIAAQHVFELAENPTKEQMKLRKAWLGDYRMAGENMENTNEQGGK